VSIGDFGELVESRLGLRLRSYQVGVIGDVLGELEGGSRAVFVSMPTGSGKTLIEVFFGYWGFGKGFRVLVLEPTRILCEQMLRIWRKVLGDKVGLAYEGCCDDIEDRSKEVVIATPQTALKCLASAPEGFGLLVIDEVHHAFGTQMYGDVVAGCRPEAVLGFTALVPSYRRILGVSNLPGELGVPVFLDYDFKALSDMGGFRPPLAIADFYDSVFDELENTVYEALFMGSGVKAPTRVIRHLELTLARHGVRAFCESLHAAINRGDASLPDLMFEELCDRKEFSHKARALIYALSKYDLKAVSPVLVYTTRKATAHELAEALGTLGLKIAVLTGDVPRNERARIVSELREGVYDALVSTRVGEEGLDIPEAGLLVMSDVAKSELRFYQRLGRLLRLASPKELKYLVVTLTPKTVEYNDLREAMWNLRAAGVDVSYLIVNVSDLSASRRAVEILEALTDSVGEAIPYATLARGEAMRDPVVAIERLSSEAGYGELGVETPEELIHVLFSINTRDRAARKLLRRLESMIPHTSITDELDVALETGQALYVYDPAVVARILSTELKLLHKSCLARGGKYCRNPFFRLDRKDLLKLFMRVFPNEPSYVEEVERWLRETAERAAREAEAGGLHYRLTTHSYKYNPASSCLISKLTLEIIEEPALIVFEPQIYYYCVKGREQLSIFKRLVQLNLLSIGHTTGAMYLTER